MADVNRDEHCIVLAQAILTPADEAMLKKIEQSDGSFIDKVVDETFGAPGSNQ